MQMRLNCAEAVRSKCYHQYSVNKVAVNGVVKIEPTSLQPECRIIVSVIICLTKVFRLR